MELKDVEISLGVQFPDLFHANAEFVHIRDGVCLRAYTQYDGEVDTDEGILFLIKTMMGWIWKGIV